MLSSGTKFYHLGWNVIIWDAMLSSGANVIIWDYMLSSGMQCYHLELMSIWDKMISSGANVIHNSIIWSQFCHLVLSCDVIIWDDNTPLFYFSWKLHSLFKGTLAWDGYIYHSNLSRMMIWDLKFKRFNILLGLIRTAWTWTIIILSSDMWSIIFIHLVIVQYKRSKCKMLNIFIIWDRILDTSTV